MKPLTKKDTPDPLFGAGVGGISYSSCKQVGVMEVAQDAGAPVAEPPALALVLAFVLEAAGLGVGTLDASTEKLYSMCYYRKFHPSCIKLLTQSWDEQAQGEQTAKKEWSTREFERASCWCLDGCTKRTLRQVRNLPCSLEL